jgi:orotate phosphoribosyltransferase-like protein
MARTGRPSKYKAEYCSKAVELFSDGRSIIQIAAELNVSRDTIYEWQKIHPEFSDSIKRGLTKSEAYWERMLQGAAAGLVNVNSAALIFLLKNRFQWKDRIEQDIDLKGGVDITHLTPEERDKEINALLALADVQPGQTE